MSTNVLRRNVNTRAKDGDQQEKKRRAAAAAASTGSAGKPGTTSRRIGNTMVAIVYSAALNHFLLAQRDADGPQATGADQPAGLPSLPLRHSSLATLLPHIIYESILIGSLSHSSLSSFGACLHLLKLPLLSTVYRYFKIGFTSGICHSLAFDLVNYLGQFLIFYVLSTTPVPSRTSARSRRTSGETEPLVNPEGAPEHEEEEEDDDDDDGREQAEQEREVLRAGQKTQNLMVMSLLTWLLISLLDGLVSFVLERSLSARIEADVQEYLAKLKLDQYFLLKPSETTGLAEILREFPAKDRPMMDHQLLAPVVNLPYFFSSASLVSLPSDFILLDRLPMLSLRTKTLWLLGLVGRRLAYSGLAWFFKT